MRRIGMLTSGGDCQALNATMRGVAKSLYNKMCIRDSACAPCSAEQVGMADSFRRYLVFQGLHDWVLSLYILKRDRAPFAV